MIQIELQRPGPIRFYKDRSSCKPQWTRHAKVLDRLIPPFPPSTLRGGADTDTSQGSASGRSVQIMRNVPDDQAVNKVLELMLFSLMAECEYREECEARPAKFALARREHSLIRPCPLVQSSDSREFDSCILALQSILSQYHPPAVLQS
jgi:hypothetical protein